MTTHVLVPRGTCRLSVPGLARLMSMTAHPSPTADERLSAFANAVRASPHNLLSKRGLEELERRHIAESVAFAAGLPDGPARVLDLGTGGGFPGMVIAITRPDLHVTLLDSTKKKVAFLRETADALGVEVETVAARAEEAVRQFAGSFELVTARAVASLDVLAGWALPFLAPGGQLHAIKGERWADELRDALPVLRRAGASVVAVPDEDSPPSESTGTPAPRVVIIRAPGSAATSAVPRGT